MTESPPPARSITSIDALRTDPNQREIRVDGRVVACVPARVVEALELAVGVAWTDAIEAAIARAEAIDRAHRAALDLLGRRAHSACNLAGKLTAKGHDADVVAEAIDDLTDAGWLDDASFALDEARRFLRQRPATAAAVTARLEGLGVAPDVAARAAAEALDGVDAIEAALDVARSVRREPAPDDAPRIARRLAQRGFDEDTVATVLHRLGIHPDDRGFD